jgi:hypothetical protein
MPSPPLPRPVPVGTFRIDPTFRAGAVALAVGGTALIVAILLRMPGGDRVRGALLLAPLVLLFVGLGAAALMLRVDFDGATLVKRSAFGTRSLRVEDITRVRYVGERHTQNNFTVRFGSSRRRAAIVIAPKFWDRTNDLVQLVRALDPQHQLDPVAARLEADERAQLRRELRGD